MKNKDCEVCYKLESAHVSISQTSQFSVTNYINFWLYDINTQNQILRVFCVKNKAIAIIVVKAMWQPYSIVQ